MGHLNVVLICISLITNEIHKLTFVTGYLNILLNIFLASFSFKLTYSDLQDFFWISWIPTLCYLYCKYLLTLCDFAFHSLTGITGWTIIKYCQYFSFMVMPFYVLFLKKSFSIPKSWRYIHILSFRTILAFQE